MRNIAKALLNSAMFLDQSSNDEVDPDSAVKALEQIAFDLSGLSKAESDLLADVARELAHGARAAGPGFQSQAQFFDSFVESFGAYPR